VIPRRHNGEGPAQNSSQSTLFSSYRSYSDAATLERQTVARLPNLRPDRPSPLPQRLPPLHLLPGPSMPSCTNDVILTSRLHLRDRLGLRRERMVDPRNDEP
jgi:hypothetical protein